MASALQEGPGRSGPLGDTHRGAGLAHTSKDRRTTHGRADPCANGGAGAKRGGSPRGDSAAGQTTAGQTASGKAAQTTEAGGGCPATETTTRGAPTARADAAAAAGRRKTAYGLLSVSLTKTWVEQDGLVTVLI